MSQIFLHVMAPDAELSRLRRALEEAGFRAGPSPRAVGGLHVRVRKDSGDEDLVKRIAAQVAPGAHYGPPGAPTMHLEGYREGR